MKLPRLLIIVAIVFSMVVIMQPTSNVHATSSANCVTYTTGSAGIPGYTESNIPLKTGQWVWAAWYTGYSGSYSISITYPGGTTNGVNGVSSGAATSDGTASVDYTAPNGFDYVIEVCSPSPVVALFNDGRLNDNDAAETAAVYCMTDGSVRVYTYAEPKWVVSFTASPAEIAAVPTHPAANTLIKQGWHAQLYRLTNGKLQVNAPGVDPSKGDYSFRFNGCVE